MSLTWQCFLWFEHISQRRTRVNPGSPVCGTMGESVEPSGGGVFVGGSGSQKMGLEALQPGTTSCHCLLPVYWCSVTSQPAAPAAMLPCLDGLYSPGHEPCKPFSPSLFVGMLFHSREKVTKAKIGVERKNLKYCSKDLASLPSAQPHTNASNFWQGNLCS